MKQEDYYNDLLGEIPEEDLDPTDLDYWDRRCKLGRTKALESPEELWQRAQEYFTIVKNSPFYKNDFVRGGPEAGKVIKIPTIRPYTWNGLNIYLYKTNGLIDLDDYVGNKGNRYAKFAEVIRAIDKVIRDQKFEGASVGAFQHNIIARDLGLVDKTETKATIVEQPLFGPDPETTKE